MAEFKLERFKYNWQGEWAPGTEYRRDDVVYVSGKSYVCIKGHTSSNLFHNDLTRILPSSEPPQPDPYWVVMTSSRTFAGEYLLGESYNLGDIVLYDGNLYECVAGHIATDFASQFLNWKKVLESIDFKGEWQKESNYGPNAVVKYNGIAYRCRNPHTSGNTLEENINDWQVFYNGTEWRGSYQTGTEYRTNDYVRFGGSIFVCIQTHTSITESIDTTKFVIEFTGSTFAGEWSASQFYGEGDIVRFGGYLYLAQKPNVGTDPTGDSEDSSTSWIIIAKTYDFKGDFSIEQDYKTGDIVQRGGYLYEALQNVNRGEIDASTLGYLNEDVWQLLIPGKKWRDEWAAETLYSVGDVVYYYGNAYTCNQEHISVIENSPGDNGNIFDYWDLTIQAGQEAGLEQPADLLTYGLSRTRYGDQSTLGPTRIPIGEEQQLLSVTEEQEIFWRNTLYDADVVYVGTNGRDEPGYGTDKFTPFKTVRYACEYVEDNFAPLTLVKIAVSAGYFSEIGPIVIPAGCAVVGDELRSTTIAATDPIAEYQNKFDIDKAIINHLLAFIDELIVNEDIGPTIGNEIEQVFSENPSTRLVVPVIQQLIEQYLQFIEFNAYDGEINPTLSGSNQINSNPQRINASNIIRDNLEFIIAECVAFTEFFYPDEDTKNTRIQNDIRSLIRGLVRDLRFDGNYGTLKAAERYANAVTGSRLTDLFYVRDTTGVRNCTIQGLQGDLNPPGVFAIFQRPTGGACVSLDPGWGPDDERTWIVNRSPYIQGVTNIGERCVGKKVDGSLHNGGNRSMVSNDFTQVLSDGIGAWVLNNGRTELVSIFTYYCSVGYLAENGGIIRSAQGNNSYGNFGSIADGNDSTEIPDLVEVFNRNNEAQVNQAFAGGSQDELFIFEYSNAGEEYTEANATIIGAGAEARIEYSDFRDGAVFEPRLVNTKGSGSKGGTGYEIRSFSAQITPDASSTIKLSTNDPTQFVSEIQGMRIVIESGKGVGQYAVVNDFDVNTLDLSVIRESDGQPGWDHIIPGTPLVDDFDSTAVYKIEPRIITNSPGFTSENFSVPSSRQFVDVTFGNTTDTYTNISVETGTGDTFDDEAISAIFNVERTGETYNPVLIVGGAGYAVGDTIVIPGSSLGGTTPENDLIIDVTEVSEDSTNSIISFTSEGKPRGGRFVGIAQPNFAFYSDDGETLLETNTSFVGDYVAIASGNNVFVAIAANVNTISYSTNGEEWITRSLPLSDNWVDIAFGNGKFVIIAEGSNNVLYSENGLDWTTATIPAGTDSSAGQWQSIDYGQGRFVAISGDANAVAYSDDGVSWFRLDGVLGTGFYDWAKVVYGDNRFIAISKQGETLYSLNKGEEWLEGGQIESNAVNNLQVVDAKFSQGIFFVIIQDGELPTTVCLTSEYGLSWTEKNLNSEKFWRTVAYGNTNGSGSWLVLASGTVSDAIANVTTGRQAKFRADVFTGIFQLVKIWDPGSGYSEENPCEISVIDPNFVTQVEIDARYGNRSLPQPDFVNRGSGYRSSSSTISISGNGYADIIPEGQTLTVSGVDTIPGPGVQIRIDGILDPNTPNPDDLALFVGVEINDLGDDGTRRGTRLVEFTISPRLENEFNLQHGTPASLRSRYSQCRISGHDFLDIGTGNFEATNYPDIYAGGNFFVAAPENEIEEINGGRVFYTSTDQDGNFRTGELFGVDQATGIVTISAEFFDLDGLSELALGGIRLGGSGAVVNEFSTDVTFSADSNNVVPTQRAIATFLADRLSVGGENLETNQITAGRVRVGGFENQISTTSNEYLDIPRQVDFSGQDANGNPTEIKGTIIGQMLALRDFTDSVQ